MTAPGLEDLLAKEISSLIGKHGETSSGGVEFSGGMKDMRRVNLQSRIANRVLVRLDEFHASSFHELERRAKQVEWERFVASGKPVRFRVTCRKSRLYHSDAVAERLATAVKAKVGGNKLVIVQSEADEELDDEAANDAQLFVVRVTDDICSISADSSGELLHRRGYRQAVAKAPLRETIAAAMVIGSGWDMTSPLVDPMCGAGTIAIEAAMMARKIAPGANRRFAFESWPKHNAAVWKSEIETAHGEVLGRMSGANRRFGPGRRCYRCRAKQCRACRRVERHRLRCSGSFSRRVSRWTRVDRHQSTVRREGRRSRASQKSLRSAWHHGAKACVRVYTRTSFR